MNSCYVAPRSERVREMFTRITPRYDLLNAVLSLHLDASWRRWAAARAVTGSEKAVLDVGTGTGKFLEAFLTRACFERAVGFDLCESMLARARQNTARAGVSWLAGDVSSGLPFRDGSFDLVTAAFTLRSLEDLGVFFTECARVLRTGGKAVFLELTRPAHPVLKMLYYPYLKFYLPLVGGLMSRSFTAYSFLANSILGFDEPAEIGARLGRSGFSRVDVAAHTGGIATLILGTKA